MRRLAAWLPTVRKAITAFLAPGAGYVLMTALGADSDGGNAVTVLELRHALYLSAATAILVWATPRNADPKEAGADA